LIGSAQALWSEAKVRRQRGDPEGELDCLTQAFLIHTRDGGFDDDARTLLERSVAVAAETGDVNYCREMLENLAEHEPRQNIHRTLLLNLANLMWSAGEPGEALGVLERLSDWLGPLEDIPAEDRQEFRSWFARLPGGTDLKQRAAVTLGQVLSSYGEYERAEWFFALAPDGSSARLCRANNAADCGRWDAALSLLELELSEPSFPGSRLNALTARYKIWSMRGEFGKALEDAEAAVRDAENSSLIRPWRQALLNRASLRIPMNETYEAGMDLKVATVIGLAAGLDNRDVHHLERLVRQRERMGSTAAGIGPPGRELFEDPQRKKSAPVMPEPAIEPEESSRPARWLSYFERLEMEAIQSRDFSVVDARWAASESPVIQARVLVMRGVLQADDRALSEALEQFDKLGMLPDAYQALRWLRDLRARKNGVGFPAASLAAMDRELDRRAKDLAQSLNSTDRRETFLVNKWTEADRSRYADLADSERLYAKANDDPWWKRWRSRLEAIRTRFEWIRRLALEEADRHRDLFAAGDGTKVKTATRPTLFQTLRAFYRETPAREALVRFVSFPEQTVLIWQSRGVFECRSSDLPRIQLREGVKEFYAILKQDRPRSEAQKLRLLDTLGTKCGFSKLVGEFGAGVERICILADDQLHKIPFAAIPIQGRPLLETHEVRMELGFQPAAADTKESRGIQRAVVAALRDTGPQWPTLDKVPLDASFLEAFLRQVGLDGCALPEEEVRLERLRKVLPESDLFHFSGHGAMYPNEALHSGLVLHGGQEVLSFQEIASMTLPKMELATLFACYGADNFIFPGRRVSSLPLLLRSRGVGNIVAPLWPVKDEIAHELLVDFYTFARSMRLDRALRMAQLKLRREHDKVYDWAAFILTGNGKKLSWGSGK
jgi:hypothetical protein